MHSRLDPGGKKTAHVDLSSREHVRIPLNPQLPPDALGMKSSDLLFIGKPVLGKVQQRWTIQLSRRIAALKASCRAPWWRRWTRVASRRSTRMRPWAAWAA